MLSKLFNGNNNKKAQSDESEMVVTPGKVFRWPRDSKITAIDMVVIALPKQLFQDGKIIGTVVDADDKIKVVLSPDSDNVFFHVQPGMSLTIKKSCESYIVANDNIPRKILITEPKVKKGV